MTAHSTPRVFISAGEVSGDIVAARLIEALRDANASVVVDGLGGGRMAEAGATVIASSNHLGVVGVSEGVLALPSAVRIFRATMKHCRTQRPDATVLVGNDVFNVVLGRWMRAQGIPVLALFPPQTWIWEAVTRSIAPSLDVVLASFPDEVRCYAKAGVETEFVGHYLADRLPPVTSADRAEARTALGLSPDARVVAMLPGSRREEIARLRPVLLTAADLIREASPAVRVIAALNSCDQTGPLTTPNGQQISCHSDSSTVMRAADVVLLCSGTATLEAALIGVPMVVAYRASWITYRIVRAAIRVGLLPGETVAIPNLLLRRPVVPEFIQRRLTAPALAEAVLTLLSDDTERQTMLEALTDVRALVERPGSLAAAARLILSRARL